MTINFQALTNELEVVISKIKTQAPDSIVSFSAYLDQISLVDSFSELNKWDIDWRQQVYELGTLFSDKFNINPSNYLACLDLKKWEEKEVLGFVYSEIIWNFFNNKDGFVREQFKKLTIVYPGNPEFFHSYGHYLLGKGDFCSAINNYKQAVNLEASNNTFVTTLFNCWSKYFSNLIKKNKIEEAENVLNDVTLFFAKPEMDSYWAFKNIVPSMKERLNDIKLIDQKISSLNDLIDKRVEGIRAHLVNVVALITSIIGYLLIGTNMIINQRPLKDSFFMMYGLGIVLIIFVISINYQFKSQRRGEHFFHFLKHRQFWAIVLLISVLLFSYWKINP